jgi:hypothetical protein
MEQLVGENSEQTLQDELKLKKSRAAAQRPKAEVFALQRQAIGLLEKLRRKRHSL